MLHALESGHGKTVMAGALVNSKRIWIDPIILAFSTALGHMAGVLLFTVISFLVMHEFVPEDFKFYLESVIGITIFCVGIFLLNRSFRQISHQTCSCCSVTNIKANNADRTKHLSVVGLLTGLVRALVH